MRRFLTYFIGLSLVCATLHAAQLYLNTRERNQSLRSQQSHIRERCQVLVSQSRATLEYLAALPHVLDVNDPRTISAFRQAQVTLGEVGVNVLSVIQYTAHSGKEHARLRVMAPHHHSLITDAVGDQEAVVRLAASRQFVSSGIFKPVDRAIEHALVLMAPVYSDDKVRGGVSFLIDLDQFRNVLAGSESSRDSLLAITIDGARVPSRLAEQRWSNPIEAQSLQVGDHVWQIQLLARPIGVPWWLVGLYCASAGVGAIVLSRLRTWQLNAEERLRSLAELMQSAVLRVKDGTITYANPFAHRLLGYAQGRLVGRSVFETIPQRDEDGQDLHARVRAIFSSLGDEVRTNINENVRADGQILWLAWSNRVIDHGQNGTPEVLSVGNDISELKRAEAALRQSQINLRAVNEELVAARDRAWEATRHKDRFLASMSHELRTPLNGILGFADLLHGQFFGRLNEKQRSYVEQISNSGKQLLALVSDLLDMAKIDAGKMEVQPEEFPPAEITDSIAAVLNGQLRKKGIQLASTVDPAITAIFGDKRKCKQIMLNLLSNAVKFTPEGGRIDIGVTRQDQAIRVTVTDTGIGIEPEERERIFSEFHQAEQVRDAALGGTGIGLALTRRLVELHGGEIGVESVVGRGSTFWFTLPSLTQNANAAEDNLDTQPRPTGRKILVAEDNDVNLAMILDMLSIDGHDVSVARNGLQAVELAQSIGPELIFMDHKMPVLDGLEATRRLRGLPGFSQLPIIALTASAGLDAEQYCLAAGCSAYLSKPIQTQQLFAALRLYLGNDQTRGAAPGAAP